MSAGRNPKEHIAPYEMLTDWDEVLLGDKELFKEMTEAHMQALLKEARRAIDCERRLGNLSPDVLQPEELVAETLIEAWQARHGRNIRRTLKDWLLDIQYRALQRIIQEDRAIHEPIVVSLEAFVPEEEDGDEENPFLELLEPPVRSRWWDIIPDENAQPLAA